MSALARTSERDCRTWTTNENCAANDSWTRTKYGYDALNRETSTTYSNSDPTITTTYDQSACLGLSSCQNIGHATSITDGAGSEQWSYQVDATNQRSVHVNQRTTTSSPNNITKTSTYYFDLAGNLTSITYPTGRVVNYTYDAANRPSTAVDSANGITYAAGPDTSPGGTCLADVTCYTPQGTFYALSIGETASFTGLNLTHIYNSRLQPSEFQASSTGGNAIDITYNFIDPSTSKNAGHVYSITNNIDGTRSQTFGYDQLNRITAAQTTSTYATSPAHCWGEMYQYDGVTNGAWGNLTQIAATTNSAYTGCSQESGFAKTVDGNNHLSGFGYDSSGNTSSDGVNSYTWDAESQLKTAAGVTYLYDGSGRRASKSNGKLYWYGSGGEILAETDACGNATAEYIFFGGQRIAMIPWSGASCSSTVVGNPIYYVEDLLGTSRVITTNTGVVCYDADFYPFGGERPPYTNNCPATNNYKFEGKERDTETGNDDFGARYFSNRFGRWLSADWSNVPVPVPYANLTNPQTLNLYSMVADDPESFADLDGHCGQVVLPGAPPVACSHPPQNNPGDAGEGFGNSGIGATECSFESCTSAAEVSAQTAEIATQQAAARNANQPSQDQLQKAQSPAEERLANVIYNETSGLRPTSEDGQGSAQDLHSAREAIGEVAINREKAGIEGAIAPDTLTKRTQKSLAGGEPTAVRAYNDSLSAAHEALSGKVNSTNGAKQFFLTKPGRWYPSWARRKLPTAAFGGFKNIAGRGDVRRNVITAIVITQ